METAERIVNSIVGAVVGAVYIIGMIFVAFILYDIMMEKHSSLRKKHEESTDIINDLVINSDEFEFNATMLPESNHTYLVLGQYRSYRESILNYIDDVKEINDYLSKENNIFIKHVHALKEPIQEFFELFNEKENPSILKRKIEKIHEDALIYQSFFNTLKNMSEIVNKGPNFKQAWSNYVISVYEDYDKIEERSIENIQSQNQSNNNTIKKRHFFWNDATVNRITKQLFNGDITPIEAMLAVEKAKYEDKQNEEK